MTLREAAQALLDENDMTPTEGWPRFVRADTIDALRTALAAPPEPGWEEGAEAMRTMATAEVASWGVRSMGSGSRAVICKIADGVARLPVPAAPTPHGTVSAAALRDAGLTAPGHEVAVPAAPTHAPTACTCATTGAGECPVFDAAPEAKTAESEVGWLDLDEIGWFRLNGRPMTIFNHPVFSTVRVRVTVEPEPAPVEPEETHR